MTGIFRVLTSSTQSIEPEAAMQEQQRLARAIDTVEIVDAIGLDMAAPRRGVLRAKGSGCGEAGRDDSGAGNPYRSVHLDLVLFSNTR
jgi:hypothetical protein